MVRKGVLVLSIVTCLALLPGTALAAPGGRGQFSPGAAGIGDPYYPLDGNGGYDMRHYGLKLRCDPPPTG